ncbi:hypothetical protein COW06_00335 [Candidatus Gracilibacteria bacterium CG12_big_fil_rev_8_21_14_0_65_38_15]|nr:MAG: hypothetical protein COW68_01100 [Candidatus Gracilibacteria bacterium CG18_big_fil_WC_8_21_14_2_50_38_16]PIQ42184.1 MAG: hypothetical protein COW06_00335 [Candidatus Gracilibacteria bacterium CG12_big_fil_rev_8_21_14_0_65_38_15]PIZ01628.1 MAG: hypothetical protein COY60_02555 [Candidatus Gracilibacteria bacterium CG_4_10_14_0_8_um_filter_38_28]
MIQSRQYSVFLYLHYMSAEQLLSTSTKLPSKIPNRKKIIKTVTETQENVGDILANTREEIEKGVEIIVQACRKSGNPNIIGFGGDIEESQDINMKNKYGQTLLILAVWNNNIEIVQLLLSHPEILVNEKDKHGQTALMWAAKYENTSIMKLLLAHNNILVNEKDKYGQTALILAAGHNHTEITQILLNRPEILVNETDNKNNTALIWATSKNNFQLVQLLLNRPEILVNETDRNGFTALIWASEKGYSEITQLLLLNPCLELSVNNQGKKALELAKTPEIKKLILKKIQENQGSFSIFRFLAS